MGKVKIIHERDICIGCGACANICPENWEMADDGKSNAKVTDLDDVGCNQDAADACPVNCIHVKSEE